MPRPLCVVRAAALAALIVSAPTAAQASYPPETGDALTDLAGVVTPAHQSMIRSRLADLKGRHGTDVRVVTIPSVAAYGTAGGGVEAFSTGLFNAWAIGDAARNDGVLLLVSIGDRGVRITLGDGAAPYLDRRVQSIIDDAILPRFRAGDVSGGVLAGAEAIVSSYGAAAGESGAAPAAAAAPSPAPVSIAPVPAPVYTPPVDAGRAAPSASRQRSDGEGPGGGVLGIVIMVAAAAGVGALARHEWRRARKCGECGKMMTRLDELSEDFYLSPGQEKEEEMRSVYYDVWKCACGHHRVAPRRAWFSRARSCLRCSYRTVEVRTSRLTAPTYDSTGLDLVLLDCGHCGHHAEETVVIPRLTPPSTDDDDLRSSSSYDSFSSSSYGSSSPDSGSSSRSSGGGSSSGRGASGSW